MQYACTNRARCSFRRFRPTNSTPSSITAPTPRAAVGIVCTLRDIPDRMLETFIAWHLHLGFISICLYFDDPADPGIAHAHRIHQQLERDGTHPDAVEVILCDSQLHLDWTTLTTYRRHGDHVEAKGIGVEVRQMLNCEHALRRAHAAKRLDWMLHIDSDELFYIDGVDVGVHFGLLGATGCVNILYPIHEGCPEHVDNGNVFSDVTLFRRHPSLLPKKQLRPLLAPTAASTASATPSSSATTSSAELASALDFWARRGNSSDYFLGSTQGKSAVRVLPGVLPLSVHAFYPPEASMLSGCWSAFPDTWEQLGGQLRVVRLRGRPCLLHYISCDFQFWWKKYRLLGSFADVKPGGFENGGFHSHSRDFVAMSDATTAREHYSRWVCLLDAEEAERQVEAGVCMRIAEVRQTLRRLFKDQGATHVDRSTSAMRAQPI